MPIIFDNTPSWAQALGSFVPGFINEQQRGIENNFKQQGLNQNLMDIQSLIKTRDAGTDIAQQRTDLDREGLGLEADRNEMQRRRDQFNEAGYIDERNQRRLSKEEALAAGRAQIEGDYKSTLELLHQSSSPQAAMGLMNALEMAHKFASDPEAFRAKTAEILGMHKQVEQLAQNASVASVISEAEKSLGLPPEMADAAGKLVAKGFAGEAMKVVDQYREKVANEQAKQSALESLTGQFQVTRMGMSQKQVSDTYGALTKLAVVPPDDPVAVRDAISQAATAMSGHYGVAFGKIVPDMNNWSAGGDIPPEEVRSEMVGLAMQAVPQSQFMETRFNPQTYQNERIFNEAAWMNSVNQRYQNLAKTAKWARPGNAFGPETAAPDPMQAPTTGPIGEAVKAVMDLKASGTYSRERAAELLKKMGVSDTDPAFVQAIQAALGKK